MAEGKNQRSVTLVENKILDERPKAPFQRILRAPFRLKMPGKTLNISKLSNDFMVAMAAQSPDLLAVWPRQPHSGPAPPGAARVVRACLCGLEAFGSKFDLHKHALNMFKP